MNDLFPWLTGGSLLIALFSIAITTLLPLAILGGLAVVLLRRNRRAGVARQIAATWPSTAGVVLASTTQVRRIGRSRTVIPVVVYQYQVNGQTYQSHLIRAGDQYGSIRVSGEAEAIAARYPTGAAVMVHYNPASPGQAVLER